LRKGEEGKKMNKQDPRFVRPAVWPTVRAVMIEGKLRKPRTGLEWICCGVNKFIPVATRYKE
jgi:hypothetical protein